MSQLLFLLLLTAQQKIFTASMRQIVSLFLVLSDSLFLLLIRSMQATLGIDALAQYYHMTSFNYGRMKEGDVGQIADVIRTILCLTVSTMIIER